MRTSSLAAAVALSFTFGLVSCGPPVMNTPVADIPKLATLSEVMDNQATTADPQFKRIGEESSFTDADYAAFAQASERLLVTSLKIKDFNGGKGPEFDALAMRVHDQADALGKAAAAKDAKASNAALTEMKAACKECHSKFR